MTFEVSRRLRAISKMATRNTRAQLRGSLQPRHQAPGSLSELTKVGTEKTILNEELPVLMIDVLDGQQDV